MLEPTPIQSSDRKARLQAELRKARIQSELSQARKAKVRTETRDPALDRIMGEVTGSGPAPDLPAGRDQRPSRLQAAAGNFANTMTFGNADRIAALPALAPGGETYEEARQAQRNKLAMTREDFPVTSFAGDMVGFAAPGTLVAKGVGRVMGPAVNALQRVGPALGFAAKTAQAGAVGGAGAALYGATVGAENEAIDTGQGSPGLERRLETAGEFAPLGATLGAAMPAAGVMLRPVGRAIGGVGAKIAEPFKPGSVAKFNERVGLDAARRSLERSGILTVEDFLKRAAKYGDKPAVTGELGQDALNSLTSLVRSKGTTADKAQAVLEDRIAGLPGRLLKDISDETGISTDDVYASIENMVKQARSVASPAYKDLFKNSQRVESERLVQLMDNPKLKTHLDKALATKRSLEITENRKVGDAEYFDLVKRSIDDLEQTLAAKGEPIPVDLEAMRATLVQEMDNLVPGYADVRKLGAEAPQIAEGFKTGQALMSGRFDAKQVEREISALTGAPLTAAQTGAIRDMISKIERGALTPRIVKTAGFQKKLRAIFDDAAADGLIRKFGQEAELQVKGARWNPNVGSVTSQAQMGGPSKVGDEMLKAGANMLAGNKLGLFTQAVNLMRGRGYSEPQLNALGDILLSSPDDAAAKLFPGKTPKPGSVPPTTPPAGKVRQNTPPPKGPPVGGKITTPAEAERLARAKQQGFDVDRPLYHGMPKAMEGDHIRTGSTRERGAYFTEDPAIANHYAAEGNEGGLGDFIYGEGASVHRVFVRGNIVDGDQFLKMTKAQKKNVDGVRWGGPERETVIFDLKNIRSSLDTFAPPKPPGNALTEGPPKTKAAGNALRDQPPRRQRLNTRASIKDAPEEYRRVVMDAPEGISQAEWDRIRKSTGNRLPSPDRLYYRIREIELKGNPTAAELRELKALQTMRARLRALNIKYD